MSRDSSSRTSPNGPVRPGLSEESQRTKRSTRSRGSGGFEMKTLFAAARSTRSFVANAYTVFHTFVNVLDRCCRRLHVSLEARGAGRIVVADTRASFDLRDRAPQGSKQAAFALRMGLDSSCCNLRILGIDRPLQYATWMLHLRQPYIDAGQQTRPLDILSDALTSRDYSLPVGCKLRLRMAKLWGTFCRS